MAQANQIFRFARRQRHSLSLLSQIRLRQVAHVHVHIGAATWLFLQPGLASPQSLVPARSVRHGPPHVDYHDSLSPRSALPVHVPLIAMITHPTLTRAHTHARRERARARIARLRAAPHAVLAKRVCAATRRAAERPSEARGTPPSPPTPPPPPSSSKLDGDATGRRATRVGVGPACAQPLPRRGPHERASHRPHACMRAPPPTQAAAPRMGVARRRPRRRRPSRARSRQTAGRVRCGSAARPRRCSGRWRRP